MNANILIQAETLCRAIAPDLRGKNIYIVAVGDVPEDERLAGAMGWTGGDLDLELRSFLGDRWRGRGAAMAIDVAHAQFSAWEEFAGNAVIAAVLHELAHVLVSGIRDPDEPFLDGWWRDGYMRILAKQSAKLSRGEASPERLAAARQYRLDFHDAPRFLRVCFHLQFRAERLAGSPFTVNMIVPSYEWFPDRAAYRQLLGDEPERMADLDFKSILEQPLPVEYSQRWELDKSAYLKEFPQ